MLSKNPNNGNTSKNRNIVIVVVIVVMAVMVDVSGFRSVFLSFFAVRALGSLGL